MAGKFGANMGFYVAYILPSEISPTLIRGTSTMVGNGFSKLGGFIAPYLIFIGINNYLIYFVKCCLIICWTGLKTSLYGPYFFMSIVTMLSVIMTLLVIPETNGVQLPATVAEAITNKRFLFHFAVKVYKIFALEFMGGSFGNLSRAMKTKHLFNT